MNNLNDQNGSAPSLSLYHVTQPPRNSAGGKAPLLLMLHGYGSNEQDLMALAPYLDERLFIVSARAPYSLQYGAYAWFGLQFTPDGILYNTEESLRSIDMLAQFLGELQEAYLIDPKQIYLGGFSQGAIMSLCIALQDPKLLAGLVVMSGRFPIHLSPSANTKLYEGLPILVTHGVHDAVLPIAEGRNIRDQLSKLPVALRYHEYPMAHEINSESLTDTVRWLRTQLDKAAS